MSSKKKKNQLSIPSRLTDITGDWVAELLYQIIGVKRPSSVDGTHDGLTLLQIRARPGTGFRESCHVRAKSAGEDNAAVHRFLVEIVPADPDLRALVLRHRLFEKEKLLYEEVLPLLQKYVRNRRSKQIDVTFSVPKYIYGDFDGETGDGFMVFQDFTEDGFGVIDDTLMLLEESHVMDVIRNMATLHGICIAYQTTEKPKLEEKFPLLDEDKGACAWFQEDMNDYLHEMYSTCKNFFKAIPGQESLSRWFEQKMSDPHLLHQGTKNGGSKLKSVIHGDLWHNNLFFRREKNPCQLLMTDWQMCHIGTATNDLCFLLFSSTTPSFRASKWDAGLQLYYDVLVATLRSLGVLERELTISYEEFMTSVRTSVPVSLFFCGNVQDFDLHSEAAMARNMEGFEGASDDEEDEIAFLQMQGSIDLIDIRQEKGKNHHVSTAETAAAAKEKEGQKTAPKFIVGMSSTEEENDGGNKQQHSNKSDTNEDHHPELVALEHRGLSKVPTIATDSELEKMEQMRKSRRKVSLDPRKARAMRRKLYLDLYQEAAKKGFI